MKKIGKFHLFLILALVVPSFFMAQNTQADILGDQRTFNTNTTHDQFGRSSVAATLRATSKYGYYYVENKFWDSLSFSSMQKLTDDLEALASEFDNVIYTKSIQFWGSEPNPGIDGDPRITILLEDLASGSGGYFESVNLYSKTQEPQSNEREMFSA